MDERTDWTDDRSRVVIEREILIFLSFCVLFSFLSLTGLQEKRKCNEMNLTPLDRNTITRPPARPITSPESAIT